MKMPVHPFQMFMYGIVPNKKIHKPRYRVYKYGLCAVNEMFHTLLITIYYNKYNIYCLYRIINTICLYGNSHINDQTHRLFALKMQRAGFEFL